MTPSIEKLLALAATYEEKAKALRFAAAELNGDLTDRLLQDLNEAAVVGARDLKQAQKRTKNTTAILPDLDTDAYRQDVIRNCLATGPRTTAKILAYLHTHGIDVSDYVARRLLAAMSDVKHTGATNNAQWQLRSRAGKAAVASS